MQRPSVDLPQPDSPTRPSVSPFAIVRSTPSTARSTSGGSLRSRLVAPPRSANCICRPRMSSSGSAGELSAVAASATGDHRFPLHVGRAGLVVQTARRPSVAELDERDRVAEAVVLDEPAARMKPAARRGRRQVGRCPRDRGETRADRIEVGDGTQQAEGVRVARLAEDAVDRRPSRRSGPRTSPRPGGRSVRSPRDRARRTRD